MIRSTPTHATPATLPLPLPRLAALLLLLTALVAGGWAPRVQAQVYDPETFTLSNGMKVVVVTNRRAPVVSHMVWYRVGAADEPPGKSGIAHYLEHLMFKGTETIKPGEFSKTIARNGGEDNAFTSWDYTAYFQNIARDRLELVMTMEADRMRNLRLTEEIAKPELGVVIEERKQRTDNNPSARLWEQVNATLWVHHPYGIPIIGWMHEIEGLTFKDALAFYKDWYAPNNAILVVAGDVTAAELKPLAEKTYGKIPAGKVRERVRTHEPPQTAARRVTLTDPQVRQPSWQRVWQAPSYNTAEGDAAYALDVLQSIMGDGATSRIYSRLVVERKLASSASMFYSGGSLDRGTIGISASPVPDGDLAALEKAIEEEVALLLKDGVTAEEVETAKKKLRRDAIFARDSLQGPAYAFGLALTTGGTVEEVEDWPNRIAKVTVEQVNAAARAVLSQTGHVTGILLPDPNAPKPAGPLPPAPPPGPPATSAPQPR